MDSGQYDPIRRRNDRNPPMDSGHEKIHNHDWCRRIWVSHFLFSLREEMAKKSRGSKLKALMPKRKKPCIPDEDIVIMELAMSDISEADAASDSAASDSAASDRTASDRAASARAASDRAASNRAASNRAASARAASARAASARAASAHAASARRNSRRISSSEEDTDYEEKHPNAAVRDASYHIADAEGATEGAAEDEDEDIEALLKLFWEKGYAVIKNFIPSAITDNICDKIESLTYRDIFRKVFGNGGETEYDEFRAQAPFPKTPASKSAPFKKMIKFVQHNLINNIPEMRWVPKNWVVLRSLAGDEEQETHSDFPSFETSMCNAIYDHAVQGGFIAGLMNNSSLIVYESCFGAFAQSKRKVIKFGKGDCVIFRGDLVHAGAAYDKINYRVHAVLTVKGIKWDDNATGAASVKKFKCQFCPFMDIDRKKRNNHSWLCENNPKYDEHIAKKKEYSQQKTKCPTCNHVCSVQALYKHLTRDHPKKKSRTDSM